MALSSPTFGYMSWKRKGATLVAASLFVALTTLPTFVQAIPKWNTPNSVDIYGNKCPLQDRKGLECPQLCVKSFDDCPSDIAAPTCSDDETLCDDGSCQKSCDGVTNPCLCGLDADKLATKYVACPAYKGTVTVKALDVPKKEQQIELACGQKFGILPGNATVDSEFNDIPEWSKDVVADKIWLQCPEAENERLTFTEPIFLTFYIVISAEFAILALWHLYKMFFERDVGKLRQLCDQQAPSSDSASSQDGDSNENSIAPLLLRGYRRDYFGLFGLCSVILVTMGWLVLIAIIVADHYGAVTGVEYGVFKTHLNSAKIMIVAWVMMALWITFIELARSRLVSYFRIECDPKVAQWIQVREHIDELVMMQENSKFLFYIRKFNCWFREFIGFDKTITTAPVTKTKSKNGEVVALRYFEYHCTRYIQDPEDKKYKITPVDLGVTNAELASQRSGLDSAGAQARMDQIGENFIRVYVPSFPKALLDEFTHYTYLYQLVALWIWFYFDYYQMGCVQIVVIIISALLRTVVRLSSENKIKSLAERSTMCYVRRNGKWSEIDTKHLVPGDVIAITRDMELMCDGILLSGEIIVDESSLTGEAMPVRKFAIRRDNNVYDKHSSGKSCTMFSGTYVLQCISDSNNSPMSDIDGETKRSGWKEKTSTPSSNGDDSSSSVNEKDDMNKILEAGEEPTNTLLITATRTGTDKGQMIQRILFPAHYSFVFNEHLRVSFFAIAAWGIIALGLSVWLLGSGIDSLYYGLFVMSEVLSPLLPASLVIGQSVTAARLRRMKIFCIDLPRIMMAGKIRIFCFDKTGTLTKEGLEFFGLQNIKKSESGEAHFDTDRIEMNDASDLLQMGLSSCHAVTTVGGQFVGNPVDVEQFRATGWELAGKNGYKIDDSSDYTILDTFVKPDTNRAVNVVKRFEFAHARQSMSVATLDPVTKHVHVFVKGSFERIKRVSDKASVPNDYDTVTAEWAKEGCYVLALAHKDLGEISDWQALEDMDRDTFESGCSLISLIMFRNQLKDDTTDALTELKRGDIRPVMITGDNALTGVYIAKQCGMVPEGTRVILGDIKKSTSEDKEALQLPMIEWRDTTTNEVVHDIDTLLAAQNNSRSSNSVNKIEKAAVVDGRETSDFAIELAVTAAAFDHLVETEKIRDYLLDIRIFARMTPKGKVEAVQLFMERGVTAMCGDGGNDCGALRAAHVGLALSEAEASIVSPFSTPIRTIFSCVNLVRHGRCALTTSFTGFKFIIMYGETMAWLQLFSFYFSVVITQATWIFIDSFVTVGMTLALSLAKPAKKLASSRPTAKLLGPQLLSSIIGQVLINFVFLVGMMGIMFRQPWYRCNEFDSRDINLALWQQLGDNYEAEIIETFLLYQMINAAGTFNFGHKYRESWWRNYVFVFVFVAYFVFVSVMVLTNPNRLNCLFRINCGDPDALVDLGYPRPSWHIAEYNSPIGNNVLPTNFRWLLWGYALCNAVAVYGYEYFVVLGPVGQWMKRLWQSKFGNKKLQLKL
ncbi:hypothetical protein H4219_003724 [Mycoemilia scoparia]|uniref:P-type ATPase A domain-containing protein n=1 Tax=Mycoemilia scoparia TaxID=417184 RepID=A0A9W7ZY49_9FUNG|nr:hypothetical protein H4219_003724 [Mycoemilia scoparia]